jgi:sigma-B regulation protein RsbU (phosphoserine phosphatase)
MEPDESSSTARIAGLAKLTREIGQSQNPSETLRTIRRGLREIYGPTSSLMISTRGLGGGEYRVVQVNLEGADANEESDPWAQATLPVHRGGLIAKMIETQGPGIFQGVDWSGDPVFHQLLGGYDSVIALPAAGDHVPMNWVILLRRGTSRFTSDDFEQAILRIMLISSILESQALAVEVADAHTLADREVRRVGQIQRMLLPDPLPRIPGLKIAASYETFGEAGGDLYDFISLGASESKGQRWAIFIGDASGHGPSAAVVIAIVQALLQAHPAGVVSPAALLQHINEHLCRRPIKLSFVTAFIGVYDPLSRRLTFAGAGHPPPLLMDAVTRTVKRLDSASGYPVGIDADQTFREANIDLRPGDVLLLYTDGIEEARDPNGVMFGIDGIEAALHCCSNTPEQLVSTIRRKVTAHENGRPATDDQTLVAISVMEPPAGG